MPQPYHKYVFDLNKRKFVGAFEEMYQMEDKENFDSWLQDDLNHLTKQLAKTLLDRHSFTSICDFGCGKGAFTQLLKKANNQVTGVDISSAAIKKARAKHPEIQFVVGDSEFFKTDQQFAIVIALEVFSYLENWKEVLADISNCCKYFLISLYIPPNPIGFVKSFDELIFEISTYFSIKTKLIANDECIIVFGEKHKSIPNKN